MNKKQENTLQEDIQGIANLIQYNEKYPQGAIKIGYHYYKASSLVDALKDIKARSVVGGQTKADHLLMQILAGIL
jgi:hypothetical protein